MKEQELDNINNTCKQMKDYVEAVTGENKDDAHAAFISITSFFILAAQRDDGNGGRMFTVDDLMDTAVEAIGCVTNHPNAIKVKVRKKST